MNRAITFVLMLLAPTLVMAQGNHCFNMGPGQTGCSNYNVLTAGEEFDNTANAKSMNVWHAMINVPQGAGKIVSGHDASGNLRHFTVLSNGSVYEYNDYWATSNANTFTSHSEMGTVSAIVMGNNIYSLQTSSQCTTVSGIGPRYLVYKWNGSAWTSTGFGCVFDFAASDTGDGEVIETYLNSNNAGGIQFSSQNGVWYGSPLSGGWIHVSMLNATTAIGHDYVNDGIYLLNLTNPSAPTDTRLGTLTSAFKPAQGPEGIWAIDSSSQVERWNGSAWDQFQGNGFTGIDSCGPMCTFTTNENGHLYRFPDYYMQWTAQETGNTTCNPEPCPSGLVHTPSITVKFNAHSIYGGQTTNGSGVSPETQVNISARDATYDPFYCFDLDDPASCVTTSTTGSVTCSVAGLFYNVATVGSGSGLWITNAKSRVDLGTSWTCTNSGSALHCPNTPNCTFKGPFNYYCDQGLNPDPPADYILGESLFGLIEGYITTCATNGQTPPEPPDNLWGFDISGPCYYPVPSGSPLFCLKDPLPGTNGITAGNGPVNKSPLYSPVFPKDSKGPCTITGITQ